MRKRRRIILRGLGVLLIVVAIVADVLMLGVFASPLDKAMLVLRRDKDEVEWRQAQAYSLSAAEEIEANGIVLLENDGALPLPRETKRVNLLGCRAYNPIFGGTGSGGSAYTENRVSLQQAMGEQGIEVNPAISAVYQKSAKQETNTFEVDFSIREWAAERDLAEALGQPFLFEGEASWESMKAYSDICVLVFGRGGGEDNDLPLSMEAYTDYAPDKTKHYLELNSAELSLLKRARETFGTVIVLVNASNAMELGFLEEQRVNAALWVGSLGDVGSRAIAAVLCGEVNPSGRTVDTYPYQVEVIPSYANFDVYAYPNSAGCFDRDAGLPQTAFLVEYREGIYVGYRYFETRQSYDYVTREGEAVRGAAYEDVVQYPFGYGLSYADFIWEMVEPPEIARMDDLETYNFTVRVTNTGTVAGRDVVELYYTAPYDSTGSKLQKAGAVLGDFAKTQLLQPGEAQVLTLMLNRESMASYDESGYYASGGAYALERGEYGFSLRSDAHTVKDGLVFTGRLEKTLVYADAGEHADVLYAGKRPSDRVLAENRFDDVSSEITCMTRDNWAIQAGQNREANEAQLAAFRGAKALGDDYIRPSDTAPILGKVTADHRLAISEMKGLRYDDPLWEDLLNQLSWKDLCTIVGANGWGTSAIASIRKPQVVDMDGPSAISYVIDTFTGTVTYRSVCYPSETVLASTWDPALAAKMGDAISREGEVFGVSGWYAPGVNIHRNPFSGRNFEYYSEDPVLAGTMAANVIRAAQANGMYCYLKHFALNEMETNRHNGVCTWASEQSMREIYLKAFEIPAKQAGLTAVMSAYNNLGTTWAGASRPLITGVLRGEWGFTGCVLTDNYENRGFMDVEKALLAGGSALLYSLGVENCARLKQTPSGQRIVREAAHQYLYTIANSSAADADYHIPAWRIVTAIISAILILIGACLSTGLIRIAIEKNRRKGNEG